MALAWVGMPLENEVHIAAASGDTGYLDDLRLDQGSSVTGIRLDESGEDTVPLAKRFRTGQPGNPCFCLPEMWTHFRIHPVPAEALVNRVAMGFGILSPAPRQCQLAPSGTTPSWRSGIATCTTTWLMP